MSYIARYLGPLPPSRVAKARVLSEDKVNIVAANVTTNADHTASVMATIQVASVSQLARILRRQPGR